MDGCFSMGVTERKVVMNKGVLINMAHLKMSHVYFYDLPIYLSRELSMCCVVHYPSSLSPHTSLPVQIHIKPHPHLLQLHYYAEIMCVDCLYMLSAASSWCLLPPCHSWALCCLPLRSLLRPPSRPRCSLQLEW